MTTSPREQTAKASRGPRTRRSREDGFATMTVLVAAVVIYSILTAAIQLNYRIHSQNCRMQRQLQTRAEKLHVQRSRTLACESSSGARIAPAERTDSDTCSVAER